MDLYVWGEMKINVLCCYVRVFEQYSYTIYIPIVIYTYYINRFNGAIVHVSLLYLCTRYTRIV